MKTKQGGTYCLTQKELSAVKDAAAILTAIDHPLRQKIMSLLKERGEQNVTELFIRLRVEQSVMSQHLAILRKCNLLNTRRDGKEIYYSLAEMEIYKAVSLCFHLTEIPWKATERTFKSAALNYKADFAKKINSIVEA